jgi:hypothetical protein
MITALVTLASILAYLGCWTFAARWWYQKIRPWKEPLACDSPSWHQSDGHKPWCYQRYGEVSTTGEALFLASMFGLLGPLAFIGLAGGKLLRYSVTAGVPDTREELAAKIKRLEDDKKKWENDHGE